MKFADLASNMYVYVMAKFVSIEQERDITLHITPVGAATT